MKELWELKGSGNMMKNTINIEMMNEMKKTFDESGYRGGCGGHVIRYTKDMGCHVGTIHLDFNTQLEKIAVYAMCYDEVWCCMMRNDHILGTEIKKDSNEYMMICGLLTSLGWFEELVRFIEEMNMADRERKIFEKVVK